MQHKLHHHCGGHCWRTQEGGCNIPSTTRYTDYLAVCVCCNHTSITVGLRSLSTAVLSPTSVHLTWVAPCHTQQYHIYYRGTCGAYVDEGKLDTDVQEHTLHGLQKGINYNFTVNQSGFSGGTVLSIGPAHARTFTGGMLHKIK